MRNTMLRRTVWIMFLVSSVVLIYNVPRVLMTREDAVRVAMRIKLRQIVFGLNEYYSVNRTYPPNQVVFTSAKGKANTHTWRALVLQLLSDDAVAKRYDVQRPWDDAWNLEAAKSIDTFSNFAGEHSTSVFLTTDAYLIKEAGSDAVPADAIVLVTSPEGSELWSRPDGIRAEGIWRALKDTPTLVMICLSDGEVMPFCDVVRSQEECNEVLKYGRLPEDRQEFYRKRVAEVRKSRRGK